MGGFPLAYAQLAEDKKPFPMGSFHVQHIYTYVQQVGCSEISYCLFPFTVDGLVSETAWLVMATHLLQHLADYCHSVMSPLAI